jgi:hypothetical protein
MDAPAGPHTNVTVTGLLCHPAAFAGRDRDALMVGSPASGASMVIAAGNVAW